MYRGIYKKIIHVVLAWLVAEGAVASNNLYNLVTNGTKTFQVGAFWANQGKAQQIYIQDLVGDYFTITSDRDHNAWIGLGYFLPSSQYSLFNLSFGVNAFYLFETQVSGNVIQENLFTNLSYDYKIRNIPIYFGAKALLGEDNSHYNTVLDVGIGPNIIQTRHFREISLDHITIPDQAFEGSTVTRFSAMAGISLRMNHLFDPALLECGYRFFYLGEGKLNSINGQILNNLKTGDGYAQGLLCGITV